jgi:hypothetical protein
LNDQLKIYNDNLPANTIMLGGFDYFVWRTHFKRELRFGNNYANLNKDLLQQADEDKASFNANALYQIIGNIVSNKTGLRIIVVNFAAYQAIINKSQGEGNNTQVVEYYYWHNYTDILNGADNNNSVDGKNLRKLINNKPLVPNFDTGGILSYYKRIFDGLVGNIELVDCSSFTTYIGGAATQSEIQKITDRTILLKKLEAFSTTCFELMSLADRQYCFTLIAGQNTTLTGSDETTVLGLLTSTPEAQQAAIITYFRTPNGSFGYYQGHLSNIGNGEEYNNFFSTLAKFYCKYPDQTKLQEAITSNRKFIKGVLRETAHLCNTVISEPTFTDFEFDFNNQIGIVKETNNKIIERPITYTISYGIYIGTYIDPNICALESSVIGTNTPIVLNDNWDIVLIVDHSNSLGSGDLAFDALTNDQILKGFNVKIVPAFYLKLLQTEDERNLNWRIGYGVVGTIGAFSGIGALSRASIGWQYFWTFSNLVFDIEQVGTAINPGLMTDLETYAPAVAALYKTFALVNGVRSLGQLSKSAYKSLDNFSAMQTKIDNAYDALKNQTNLNILYGKYPLIMEKFVQFVNKFKSTKIILTPSTWKDSFIDLLRVTNGWSDGASQSFINQLNADLNLFSELNTFFKGLNSSDRIKFANIAKFARANCLNCTGQAVYAFRSKKTLLLLDKISVEAAASTVSKTDLLKWVSTLIDDVNINRNLLSKLDELDLTLYAKKLNDDLASSSWGDEIKVLLKENPDDLPDVWTLLKDKPDLAFEKSFDNARWQKWAEINFFKTNTQAGRDFEISMLNFIKARTGAAFNKLATLVDDLADRKLLSQVQFCLPNKPVPCTAAGDYFIADQVWVKFDANDRIVDMVILDTKLSQGTGFSTGQTAAKNHVGDNLTYKPNVIREFDVNGLRLPSNISQGQSIKIKSFYKLYGDGAGNYLNID